MFLGRFVYDQANVRDHFLMKLEQIIPWQRFTYKLVKYYRITVIPLLVVFGQELLRDGVDLTPAEF